ncbi:MAG: TRAP transporter substrate-binding protein [Sulfuritalea sp.]|nr:TRAP transporter substrate-binding protein [Polynucleobacter sp.]MCF8189016.1 TRAP transporter substrate-binding protein [Sulfuritalea sp.]
MIRRCLLALLCLLLVVGGNAWAQSPIVIKFSHVVAKDTPKGKAAEKFKELAEAASKGRVKIEVYANSTLYKDKEELEALQLGAVQMLAPSMAKFGPLGVKEFELFDFPYLFTDQQSLERVTNGPVGKEMLKRLETKGLIGLSFWDNGFKIMSSNRSMHVPTDLKGLKLRIQASKVLDEQMRALGANPQVMAFSEVYQALQTGVVDGLENVPSNLYTQKMHEVQKHMTVTNHGYIGYAVVVNKKFWEKLPADVRSQLDGAMKEATEYANKIAQQENEAALDAIRKSGKVTVYMPTDAEKAEWRKVMLPVHKTMEERIGKDLIAAASKAAVGK